MDWIPLLVAVAVLIGFVELYKVVARRDEEQSGYGDSGDEHRARSWLDAADVRARMIPPAEESLDEVRARLVARSMGAIKRYEEDERDNGDCRA